VTLRARLTLAVMAVALGPIVIGAAVVAAAAGSDDRAGDLRHLDVAASAVRTTVIATCDRLAAAAQSAATADGGRVRVAESIVSASRASAVRIDAPDGATIASTPNAPAQPWVLCAPVAGTTQPHSTGTGPGALAAAVPLRDASDATTGFAYAAQALDAAYLRQLSRQAGATIMLARAQPVDRATDSYVRTVTPIAGQPLEIAVSVPTTTGTGLIVVVIGVIVLAAVAAFGGARAIARRALRPLDELARAAGRVAAGELETRVPVRNGDEIGQVGAAVNRMSHEMRSYAEALAASRDQLRGHLDVLGATLSSTHDRPGILRVILASAIAATGAARGVVLLPSVAEAEAEAGAGAGADAARGDRMGETSGPIATHVSLTAEVSIGFDDSAAIALRSLAIVPGVGLLGTVSATAIARRGRVTEPTTELDSELDSELDYGEPRCATYLAVPLPVPPIDATAPYGPDATEAPAVAGVLALYDRIGGDFDETDLQTVRTLAQHAAVAVENVRRHDEAQRLSHTDSLTGLYNYRHLQDTIGREINRSARFGHSMCVLVLDLDRFKDVNDTYGHAAGDAVLVEFARRITGEIRGVDLAFRVGGEEFVVLLPETVAAGGEVLARRLGSAIRDRPVTVPDVFRAMADLATVEMPLVTHAIDAMSLPADIVDVAERGAMVANPARHLARIAFTVSIGVAVFPDHGDRGSDLLQAADAALYAAKNAGRDTYRIAAASAAESPTSQPLVRPVESAAPVQRADHDVVINGVEHIDATAVEVEPAERSGGASTTGPPSRSTIGR
jgi:two-component system, cell cycle response regulator